MSTTSHQEHPGRKINLVWLSEDNQRYQNPKEFIKDLFDPEKSSSVGYYIEHTTDVSVLSSASLALRREIKNREKRAEENDQEIQSLRVIYQEVEQKIQELAATEIAAIRSFEDTGTAPRLIIDVLKERTKLSIQAAEKLFADTLNEDGGKRMIVYKETLGRRIRATSGDAQFLDDEKEVPEGENKKRYIQLTEGETENMFRNAPTLVNLENIFILKATLEKEGSIEMCSRYGVGWLAERMNELLQSNPEEVQAVVGLLKAELSQFTYQISGYIDMFRKVLPKKDDEPILPVFDKKYEEFFHNLPFYEYQIRSLNELLSSTSLPEELLLELKTELKLLTGVIESFSQHKASKFNKSVAIDLISIYDPSELAERNRLRKAANDKTVTQEAVRMQEEKRQTVA